MAQSASAADWLKTHALTPLPQHFLSRIVFSLTRRRSRFTRAVIEKFARTYDVDMHDAAEPELSRYDTFNAFFTRALTPAARPIATGTDLIASPADGRFSALGDTTDGRLVQAKGIDYTILDLLGGDGEATERLGQGSFATIYLSPRDYHRLHMPLDGQLIRQTHVPGRLFSVGPHAVRTLDGLFTRNERVVALFETPSGLMALVLVGAINVAAIETVWHGLVTPPKGRSVSRIDYSGDDRISLAKGDEMGRFNMGSTIVMLTEKSVRWDASLEPEGAVRMGQSIGTTGE